MKWGKRIFAGVLAVALTVALAACGTAEPSTSGQGSQTAQKDPIKIATKPMTEQYILGEMLALVIEDATGYPTEILTCTRNIRQAAGRSYSSMN